MQDRKCHHMTIWYNPPKGTHFPAGLKTYVQIVGWAADSRGQAVYVFSPEVPSHNPMPHVTLAVAEGTNAAYSNDLLSRGYNPVQGPRLQGEVMVMGG